MGKTPEARHIFCIPEHPYTTACQINPTLRSPLSCDTLRRRIRSLLTVFTIGHSTHPWEEFRDLLRAHGVKRLIDVRTIPRSRHNPQFNRDTLSKKLRNTKIGYVYLKSLGGLRRARPDSPNGGWRNASFRGYADYMQTPEFDESLQRLIKLAREKTTAIMCAEAVPWRCHRSLIADALTIRGIQVKDISTAKSARPHSLTKFAHVRGKHITYPPYEDSPAVDK